MGCWTCCDADQTRQEGTTSLWTPSHCAVGTHRQNGDGDGHQCHSTANPISLEQDAPICLCWRPWYGGRYPQASQSLSFCQAWVISAIQSTDTNEDSHCHPWSEAWFWVSTLHVPSTWWTGADFSPVWSDWEFPKISYQYCSACTTPKYEFEHRGVFRSVDTRKGIRQGCRAAPCLWTVFISVLMMDIEQHIFPQFLLYCITIFADDLCSHQIFHNEEDFLDLIKAFGTLLDLIEAANLEVNLAKTTVTLRMRGQMMHKLQRRFIVRTQYGTFLKIPRADGTHTRIRLVRSFKYLGVVFHTTISSVKPWHWDWNTVHKPRTNFTDGSTLKRWASVRGSNCGINAHTHALDTGFLPRDLLKHHLHLFTDSALSSCEDSSEILFTFHMKPIKISWLDANCPILSCAYGSFVFKPPDAYWKGINT